MQKNQKTKLQVDIKNLETEIQSFPPDFKNKVIPLINNLKQSGKDIIEALRLANVCLVYKVDQEKFEYFKSLFYRQTKKINISD